MSGDRPVPDRSPGNYYVSLVRGKRVSLLAGPFVDDHATALAMVDRAKLEAERVDPWSWFDPVGTVRMPSDFATPGVLNSRLGLPS